MGFLPRALDKMLGMEPLAGKPSLHIDDTDKDRVDLASSGRGFQVVKGKLSSHDMSSLGKVTGSLATQSSVQTYIYFVFLWNLNRSRTNLRYAPYENNDDVS